MTLRIAYKKKAPPLPDRVIALTELLKEKFRNRKAKGIPPKPTDKSKKEE